VVVHYPQYDFGDSAGLWPCVAERCLKYHLVGFCYGNCQRANDHAPLTKEEAEALEHALHPAISASGPIVRMDFFESGHKREHVSSDYNDATAKRQRLDRVANVSATGADLAKRYTAPGQEARFDSGVPTLRVTLPIDLGKEFYRQYLLGPDGGSVATALCERFQCTLQLRGKAIKSRAPYSGKECLTVTLRGSDVQQLQGCRLEIERILVQSVPPQLRAYTLYKLGRINGYHPVQRNLVQTVNPFPDPSGGLFGRTLISVG